jgi:hypothetical protein
MMWVVRQLLASHSGEAGLSAPAVSALIAAAGSADADSEGGALQNGKILFIGQRHADGCERPDGCAFAYEGDHQGGWARTARSVVSTNAARRQRLQWGHALLATNHNMERGAAYDGDAALAGVPSSVFNRDVSYSSRWRYLVRPITLLISFELEFRTVLTADQVEQ